MKLKVSMTRCLVALVGSTILAFGLYNIHSISNVTEGGALGLTLLLEYWFGISPAVSGLIMNIACYAFGFKILGKEFMFYSVVSAVGFSAAYKIFELFPRVYPEIADMPLLASIIGGVLVGVGVGLCVMVGGAPSGDDALVMGLSHVLKIKIEFIYLFLDIVVILLSMTYIPFGRIVYSLLTVVISGPLVGIFERFGKTSQ